MLTRRKLTSFDCTESRCIDVNSDLRRLGRVPLFLQIRYFLRGTLLSVRCILMPDVVGQNGIKWLFEYGLRDARVLYSRGTALSGWESSQIRKETNDISVSWWPISRCLILKGLPRSPLCPLACRRGGPWLRSDIAISALMKQIVGTFVPKA